MSKVAEDKKINDKTLKAIYFILGALILFLAYRFGYMKLQEMNEGLDNEIRQLTDEVSAMRLMQLDEDNYAAQSAAMETEIDRIFASIPAGRLQEDQIMFARSLERTYGLTVSAVGLNGDVLEYTMNADASNPADDGKLLYVSTVTVDCRGSYDQIKACLRGIQAQNDKMAVGDATFGVEAESGLLSGTMTLQMYFMLGSDKEYVPVTIDGVSTGTDNIFGNLPAGGVPEGADNGDDAEDGEEAGEQQ